MTVLPWGFHQILNITKCSPKSIRCPNNIKNFSNELVRNIKMVPYGEPQIVMFGTGNKKGYTLVQLIETSNITAHFVEETNDIYMDVFSCKHYNSDVVKDTVKEFFDSSHIDEVFMVRQAKRMQ